MSWQPIETAPRDGSIITVRRGGLEPFHVFWKRGRWIPVEYDVPEPTHWLERAAEEEVP